MDKKTSSELIVAAKIKEPFGIKGMARVISYLSNPLDIANYILYDENSNSYKLSIIKKERDNNFVVTINDILDRTLIEGINKMQLYVKVADLPSLEEDEHYIKDIENLEVVNEDLQRLGKITGYYNFGAGDIFEITFDDESSELYPFVKIYFPKITKDYVVFVKPKESDDKTE